MGCVEHVRGGNTDVQNLSPLENASSFKEVFWQELCRTENPIAGIAQAGDDVPAIIQMIIDRRGVDRYV